MDIAAKLADAQIVRVAIIDDDLSESITSTDLRDEDAGVAALLNDRTDPDRGAYLDLLAEIGTDVGTLTDIATPLAAEDVRRRAPERIRVAAEAVLRSRAMRAEPVSLVIDLLRNLGISEESIDFYSTPHIGHDKTYDLIVVDYFLVDTTTTATLPFIREMLSRPRGQDLPLQVILMSSNETQLITEFRDIRPDLKASSSRMRIMGKPRSELHLVGWRAALWQLASDRRGVPQIERFIKESGTALEAAAQAAGRGLWELDLQAMDLLHELAAEDNDDYSRYVEDAVSRRLLSALEEDEGMRPSLQQLDTLFAEHRPQNELSATGEVGDSRGAIHGLMHSMEWRAGKPELPTYPAGDDVLAQALWVQRNLRFGMVLMDTDGGHWLNVTQACDLAQADPSDFGSTSVVMIRGQHKLPSVSMRGDYFVSMSAMQGSGNNHVLTWNLRDLRTETIKSFGSTFGSGWQVVGELRPDRAQDIGSKFGARMARVGLPLTLSAWRLSGYAIRFSDLADGAADAEVEGLPLAGHAVQRASAKIPELLLDWASMDQLVSTHGTLDNSVVSLLTGVSIKLGSKQEVGGRAVCAYKEKRPVTIGDVLSGGIEALVRVPRSREKVLIALWSAD